jgi:hypothetical protein
MSFKNFLEKAMHGISFVDRFREYSDETNWNNGEVVQRGSGENYGNVGFLRPGFSYSHFMDYLHSKAIEHNETEHVLVDLLSRDWMAKIAASIVPRGMETNMEFIATLKMHLQKDIFAKFVQELKADKKLKSALDGKGLEKLLISQAMSMASPELNCAKEFWDNFMGGLNVDADTKSMIEDPHVSLAKTLSKQCLKIIEFASEQYLTNKRISSNLLNQPKPVDSIVDDFAVEAQNFANSLSFSATLSAGALALLTFDGAGGVQSARTYAAILGGLNIAIAFGTMTNVARYKIRNEEARIVFKDEKFSGVKQGIFSLMERTAQDTVPLPLNPFVAELEKKVDTFHKACAYYNVEESTVFEGAYIALKSNINDVDQVKSFQKTLIAEMADAFHVSSYVQEDMVNIYSTISNMIFLLTQESGSNPTVAKKAKDLFAQANNFEAPLEESMQRGPVFWGFLKQRKFMHWDIMVAVRYLSTFILCCDGALAPIEVKASSFLNNIKTVSSDNRLLRRQVRDVESFYWATHESDIASFVFMAGLSVFCASILFSIARCVALGNGGDTLNDAAFWAVLMSAFGAILAAFHLARKFVILIKLWITLGSKYVSGDLDQNKKLRTIRYVTATQFLLTLIRLGAALAASVALPMSVADNGYADVISVPRNLPAYLAMGAFLASVTGFLLFFLVEYVIRYNLTPQLGEFVCEMFREEILGMYEIFKLPENNIESKVVQERGTWEYTAREFLHQYRFDSVFAADRFGSILQYLQSGMTTPTAAKGMHQA